MKSEIIKEPESKPIYPRLMEHKELGYVVLATAITSGVVLAQGQGSCPVGYDSDNWVQFEDTICWNFFEGKIILSNNS